MFLFVSTLIIFLHGATAADGPAPPHYWGFTLAHSHTTLGRTLLDDGSTDAETSIWREMIIRRDRIQTPTGFEPAILIIERSQTYALDRAVAGIGFLFLYPPFFFLLFSTGAKTHCGFVFYSPVSGFSLLAYEVSWSHITTRHSR